MVLKKQKVKVTDSAKRLEIQKYISKYNLKHMTLILDTELKENDIHAMCKRVNPDDVIRLD